MEVRKYDRNAPDDLVLLESISEDGIVNCLDARFRKSEIYTYIGPVLISMNPFKNINGLYTKNLMTKYYGRYKYEVAPHVFGSAEDAYHKLMSFGIDQCILVSGESGAGKTEAAKKLMEYVATVSSDTAELETGKTVSQIKDALLKSNPVLEAFGNAKTLRNDNSSRFGKYMEIQMDYNGTPLGGRITNYLLEKPRVVHQTKGERNFHIFYLLCAGAPRGMQSELLLESASNFRILAESESIKVKSINDEAWFEEMDEGMAAVGIDHSLKMEVFSLVAAVLWLGNMQFAQGKWKGQDACKVSSGSDLDKAAKLLSVSPQDLEYALTTRTRASGMETVSSPLPTIGECEKVRDALCKALYSRMFQRLVDMINNTIHVEKAELNLGVLDIYGFEIFEHNSFEQLCINYCNEKLQQYFIELTLKAEQEEYRKEGIKWVDIDYFNNKIVCDLIEAKRPAGVIAYLDEESIYPKGTDMSLLKKMNGNLARHAHYESLETKAQSDPTEFLIHHYAGDVSYSVEGMLDKNKDQLFRDLLVLCGDKSRSDFITSMFPEGREAQTSKRPTTAGTQFVKDMQALIETLSKCEPHYIRCIKSNDRKSAMEFNRERIIHQVRYLGLLENVRVRRAGYAYRREYDLFVRRYKMLSEQTWPKSSGNDKADTTWLLQELSIGPDEYQNGKTKIFIKDPKVLFKLEAARDEKMHQIVINVQRAYRAWKGRLYFQEIREKSVQLLANQKRRRNSWVLYFLGDYLNCAHLPQVRELMDMNGDRKVVFADHVDVQYLGKKRRSQREILILSKNALLFVDNNYELIHRIPYSEVDGFGLSTYADGWMIVRLSPLMSEKGLVERETFIMHSLRKTEITTVLVDEYKAATGNALNLKFKDSHEITVMISSGMLFKKKKPVGHTLTFGEDRAVVQGKRNDAYVATFVPQLKKKDPGYDKMTSPFLDEIKVSPILGSNAALPLDAPIPQRVLEHTAAVHMGKKRRNPNRRRY